MNHIADNASGMLDSLPNWSTITREPNGKLLNSSGQGGLPPTKHSLPSSTCRTTYGEKVVVEGIVVNL